MHFVIMLLIVIVLDSINSIPIDLSFYNTVVEYISVTY